LKRDDLKALAEKIEGIEWKESDNKNSKTVLIKKLAAAAEKQGINDFLNEHCSVDQLKSIAEDIDIEASDKKEELVKQIGNSVRTMGLEGFLSAFNVDSLQDVCEDLKLKTHHSNNKRKLIEAIVTKKDVEQEPKKKKAKVEASKKKKPIQKGSTYDDIFQHYYVGEVREFCKEKGLKTSGKKAVLIKRVLAYLEGDEESTKAQPRGKGKKTDSSTKREKEAQNGKEEEEEKAEKEEEEEEKGEKDQDKRKKSGK